ncbi:MAG: glycosyltransferase family 10 [Thermoanaerobaculia bacterium]|nr:glycosyltransferase family 10 [Thermoanaerobaculia bacterium]
MTTALARLLRRAWLPADAGETFSDEDWRELEAGAAGAGMEALCLRLATARGIEVPSRLGASWATEVERERRLRRLAIGCLDDLGAALAAGHTPATLLGGRALERWLFGAPGSPEHGRLEILVPAARRAEAERRLEAAGFRPLATRRGRPAGSWSRYLQPTLPVVLLDELPTGLAPAELGAEAVTTRSASSRLLAGTLRHPSAVHDALLLGLRVEAAVAAGADPPWPELFRLADLLLGSEVGLDRSELLVEARGRRLETPLRHALDRCETCLGVNLETPPPTLRSGHVEWLPQLRRQAGTYLDPEPTARPGLRLEAVEDGLLEVVDPSGVRLAKLNVTAASVLELCAPARTLDETADAAAAIFETTPGAIRSEVESTADALAGAGCLRSGLGSLTRDRVELPMVDVHGRWGQRTGSRFCESRYVHWRLFRDEDRVPAGLDWLFLTQFDVRNIDRYDAGRKVVWMAEPRPIAWWSYEFVDQQIDHIDVLLTYDREQLSKYPDKALFCPAGGCHLRPESWGLHPKSRLVSFIASDKRWRAPGHLARHEFWEMYRPGSRGLTQHLLGDLEVDLYGKLVGNPVDDKMDSLRDYMFQIVVENVILDSYFTEKLIDAFLAGTIPIYRGTRRAADFFDAEGILFYSTTEELLAILRDLSPAEYQRRLPHVRRNFELARRYAHSVDWAWEHTDVLTSAAGVLAGRLAEGAQPGAPGGGR